MKTLVLSRLDLQQLVSAVGVHKLMDELIARMRDAFLAFDENDTEIPERAGFYYERPALGLIEWMPLFQKQQKVVMKIVGYHPNSPAAHDVPTIVSTLSAYDTQTGHLVALIDGTFLTAMRTGAASAIASQLLARPESRTLGLIGCGAQAVTQLHAISRLFDLSDVLAYDVDPSTTATLPRRVDGILASSTKMRSVPIETVLAKSDIISVATCVDVGKGPIFRDSATKPWVHINAVGSDFPGKTELPKSLLERSFVCPDNPDQARKEGECQQLDAANIGAGLVEVARRASDFRWYQAERTVFDSTGWALEDQVAMDLVLEYAEKLRIGSSVQIECFSDDPRNPYAFLRQVSSNGEERPAADINPRIRAAAQ